MAGSDLRLPGALAQAMNDAAAHYRGGRIDDADRIVARVLKVAPELPDALHLAGLLKLETGKAALAHALLVRAQKHIPHSAPLLSNLGRALSALNRDGEAIAQLDRALALTPDSFDILNNRGIVLLKLGRTAEAVAAFERVLAIEPRYLGARANLGNALGQLGRHEDAIAQYDAVLAVQPSHAETHYNRGNALLSLGRAAEAIAAYDAALRHRPDYPRARLGRGGALAAQNRHREALADFAAVLATDRNNADAQHNEALSLLTLGDYRRGFERYEARWLRSGMPRRRSLGKPLWLGEYPPARKTILIHGEQGLGDTIQFARYAPVLAGMGAKVVIEAQPPLVPLLARMTGVAAAVARGGPLPAYDIQCPVGSLPRALRTELATVPAPMPYLAAGEAPLARWRERIGGLPRPWIAVAWAGAADHVNDRNRSLALAQFAKLFAAGPGSFISIQRELRAGDADALAGFANVTQVGDALADFDDTAAVVALADLVIGVDTAVVHLAGALARPVWVLLPFQPDWRWLLDREDSPWYPTARLFRQPGSGDWDSVMVRVRDELARLPHDGP